MNVFFRWLNTSHMIPVATGGRLEWWFTTCSHLWYATEVVIIWLRDSRYRPCTIVFRNLIQNECIFFFSCFYFYNIPWSPDEWTPLFFTLQWSRRTWNRPLCEVDNNELRPLTFCWFFLFLGQLPFPQRVLQDLYTSICLDKVQDSSKLSKVAWDFLTQVSRHRSQ